MWSVDSFILISASWLWALQELTISVLSMVSAVSINSVITGGLNKRAKFWKFLDWGSRSWRRKVCIFCFLWNLRIEQTIACFPVNGFLWPNCFFFFESLSPISAMQTKKKGRVLVSWASSLSSRSQLKWFLSVWQGEWLARRGSFCFLHCGAWGGQPLDDNALRGSTSRFIV